MYQFLCLFGPGGMRTRANGRCHYVTALGATKCAIPSRLRGREVEVGLPTLFCTAPCSEDMPLCGARVARRAEEDSSSLLDSYRKHFRTLA